MSPDGVAPDESEDEVVAAPAPDTVAPAADALAVEAAAYKKAEQEIVAESAGNKIGTARCRSNTPRERPQMRNCMVW